MADPADIAHLLRRTEFVARPDRMAALTPLSIAAAVDDVLDVSKNTTVVPPAAIAVDDPNHRGDQLVAATTWWVGLMVNQPRPVQEKMTLFWHGHFTSAISDGVSRVDLMVQQNQLYRTYALGDLLVFAQAMAIDPAMLLYLSGATNVKGSPNENFARELMELFTLGVGNYTQDDVAAAAAAWTGHNCVDGTSVFIPARHDNSPKTFFGTTKNWDGPDIVNEILRDNAGKRAIAARFIARKLWDFLAFPGAPGSVYDDLAAVFLGANLQIAPLLRAILNRPEFYSDQAKQGLVRTPAEYGAALAYHTKLDAKALNLLGRGEAMGQTLFDPPNVAGWKANSYWLNTSALSGRALLARDTAAQLRKNGGFDNLASMTVTDAVTTVATYFGLLGPGAPAGLTATTWNGLVQGYQNERNIKNNTAAATNLLVAAMLAPEFHTA